MSIKIKQKVVYDVNGKTYSDYVTAESAVVDMLGEHIDGLFKDINTGEMRYQQHTKMLISLVEKLWETRETLVPILSSIYQPSNYIQELIDDSECNSCRDC
tara:strand:+ start:281 stop:583 length:303 start_codon:yes stop_codon:yes gene_type:complete